MPLSRSNCSISRGAREDEGIEIIALPMPAALKGPLQ
ncbi:MAG: hypothetical protein H6R06_1999 [Proteobacteria bacterium]|nr:hypothetical protein [Pseudomonadota bacterium]